MKNRKMSEGTRLNRYLSFSLGYRVTYLQQFLRSCPHWSTAVAGDPRGNRCKPEPGRSTLGWSRASDIWSNYCRIPLRSYGSDASWGRIFRSWPCSLCNTRKKRRPEPVSPGGYRTNVTPKHLLWSRYRVASRPAGSCPLPRIWLRSWVALRHWRTHR